MAMISCSSLLFYILAIAFLLAAGSAGNPFPVSMACWLAWDSWTRG